MARTVTTKTKNPAVPQVETLIRTEQVAVVNTLTTIQTDVTEVVKEAAIAALPTFTWQHA